LEGHSSSMYRNSMSGGSGKDHHNCRIARFGGGIGNGGFGMQMGCVKLVRE